MVIPLLDDDVTIDGVNTMASKLRSACSTVLTTCDQCTDCTTTDDGNGAAAADDDLLGVTDGGEDLAPAALASSIASDIRSAAMDECINASNTLYTARICNSIKPVTLVLVVSLDDDANEKSAIHAHRHGKRSKKLSASIPYDRLTIIV